MMLLNVKCSHCRYIGCVKYTKIGDLCQYCINGIIELMENISREYLLLYSITSDTIINENDGDDSNDDDKLELKIYILNKNKKPPIFMYNKNDNNKYEITDDIWFAICYKYNKCHENMINRFCEEDAEYYYEYMCQCYEFK